MSRKIEFSSVNLQFTPESQFFFFLGGGEPADKARLNPKRMGDEGGEGGVGVWG